MKKMMVGLMALAVVASVAQAQNTYSKNAVGFVNIDVTAEDAAAGKMYALTIPFWNMDNATDAEHAGQWEFDKSPIAEAAARNSYVYFFDPATQSWKGNQKRSSGFSSKQWVAPGELFFLKPAGAMTITMSGEVPDEEEQDVDISPKAALTAMGNPYPVEFDFDSSDIATKATRNSYVYFWDDESQSWKGNQKRSSGFSSKKTVKPGIGFFFKSASGDEAGAENMTWKVVKPYDFPGKKMSGEE